jgi:DNA recombination protein Rad52
MTTYFTEAQNKALQAPLDPKHVVKPSGNFGPKGDYLEGWHVINELNRVFGFDGWSYTINLSRDALEKGKDGKGNEQWQAAYTCICTLTVGGVTRQAVGFGSGFAKGVGDAIEGATKEAETDALKRAARTFGNIFGLALYDKSRANVCAPAQPLPTGPINDKSRDWLQAQIDATGKPVGDFCKAFEVTSLKAITYEQIEAAKDWLRENKKAA